MTYPTALVMHPDCARHDPGWGHPEHQGRLPAIARAVERDTPALLPVVLQREAEPATLADVRRVHTAAYVERVEAAVERARRLDDRVGLDLDTVVSSASWAAALAAAGCALTGMRLVLDGEAATAFAASRPPGHHAAADRAMGFCLFNNVAIAARWAQAERGVGRVLIVDWDVHHGNGTQSIFWEDPSVYLLSVHLSPHYPGTGAAAERGGGRGAGTTRNVELPYGTDAGAYRRAFDDALEAALAEFGPELVLVSAGFDALRDDPLGGFGLEPADVHGLARRVLDAAWEQAEGRVVAVLEGGYVPERLGAGVVDLLRAFGGLAPAGRG